MSRKYVSVLTLVTISAIASGYSWDGASWADPTPFLSPISQDVKDACRAIMLSSAGSGRVAGRMGQIGDSITNSQAYFTGTLGGGTDTNETGHDFGPIMGWISPAVTEGAYSYPVAPNWNCWYRNPNEDVAPGNWRKGGTHWCNESGWRVSNAVGASHPATVVSNMNCSWAVIMYGTNDQDPWSGDLAAASLTWKTSYKAFVQSFIDLGVIPVLSTIPPEHAHVGDQRYLLANERIKEICSELDIPYIDFYAYILHHQPGNAWDGALHAEHRLISTDGTHPSNATSNFSQTALTVNGGYRARTFLTLIMAEKVREIIFNNGAAEAGAPPPTANAGADKTGYVNTLISLNGGGSTGSGLSYSWVKTSGPAVTLSGTGTATPSFTPTSTGTYVFTLTVTNVGGSDDDTVTVTVNSVVANAGGNRSVSPGATVNLNGSASLGGIDSWLWQHRGGDDPGPLNDANTVNASFTAGELGESYSFRLTVGYASYTDTDEITITVSSGLVSRGCATGGSGESTGGLLLALAFLATGLRRVSLAMY